jgi:hypothetical protein
VKGQVAENNNKEKVLKSHEDLDQNSEPSE